MSHRINQKPFGHHVPQKPHRGRDHDHHGNGHGRGRDHCHPQPACEPRRQPRGHC
jgi:hypothetical protein